MRPRTTLETPADIRRSAMDLLARREHSYAELQRKLRQRGASGDMAEVELDRLVEDGLLSD
ncbi:MAG TPA: recombination regulator RecX, partial [Pseudomonas pachastrellae]|nr:recombination regulator RecX [Halopseudomonas pachastrellae]